MLVSMLPKVLDIPIFLKPYSHKQYTLNTKKSFIITFLKMDNKYGQGDCFGL